MESFVLNDFVTDLMNRISSEMEHGLEFSMFPPFSNCGLFLFLESRDDKKLFLSYLQKLSDYTSGTPIIVGRYKLVCKSAHTGRMRKRRSKTETQKRKDINRSMEKNLGIVKSTSAEAGKLLYLLEDDDDDEFQPEVY